MPTDNLLPSGEVFHWELWLYLFNPFIHLLIPKIFIEYWQVPLSQLEGWCFTQGERVCLPWQTQTLLQENKTQQQKAIDYFF